MKLMGLDAEDKDVIVGTCIVHGLCGETCHGQKMMEHEVSVQVTSSLKDDYLIYQAISQDDPPVTCLGQCPGMFIMWEMARLRREDKKKVSHYRCSILIG